MVPTEENANNKPVQRFYLKLVFKKMCRFQLKNSQQKLFGISSKQNVEFTELVARKMKLTCSLILGGTIHVSEHQFYSETAFDFRPKNIIP